LDEIGSRVIDNIGCPVAFDDRDSPSQ